MPQGVGDWQAQPVISSGEDGTRLVPNEGVLLASAARTAAVQSADQINRGFRGVRVRTNISAITDSPSITVTIQERDSISGNYVDILASAAYSTAAQQATLIVYPGCVAVANVVANQPLPRVWRVSVTVADSDSATYSIDFSYIP